MILKITVLALAATCVFASPIEERQNRLCTGLDYPCTQSGGVFILAARGTDGTAPFTDPTVRNANYDDLMGMNDVAQALINKAGKGSYCRALPYAASPNLAYVPSVLYGASVAQNITKYYVKRCGTSAKIILMGYSQGGQVMTSALTGTLTSGGNLDSIKQQSESDSMIALRSHDTGSHCSHWRSLLRQSIVLRKLQD